MSEIFLMRYIGGPYEADRYCDTLEFPDVTWPLPNEIESPDGTGKYIKTTESQLPPQPRDSLVMRGAAYEWKPNA